MKDDYEEIRALVHAYAERIDGGDFEGVADLFADAQIVAGDGSIFSGRDTLLNLWKSSVRLHEGGSPNVCHLISNLSIVLDEDRDHASSTSYVLVMQALGDFPLQPIAVSRHKDRFAKVDGRWRFIERRDRQILVGNMGHHVYGGESD